MSTIPLLPELSEAIGRADSSDWNWMPFASLRVVADKLKIEEISTGAARQYNSIPDIWAQVAQFETALLDDDVPDRGAINVWRALVAIWAISNDQGLPLTTVRVGVIETFNRPFITAAARLSPMSVRVRGDTWKEIGILTGGDMPLAIVNPATVIAPATGMVEVVGRLCPSWVVGDEVLDPLAAGLLQDDIELTYKATRDILRQLTTLLDSKDSGTSPKYTDRLTKIVSAFANDLKRAGATGQVRETDANPLGFPADQLVGAFNAKYRINRQQNSARVLC